MGWLHGVEEAARQSPCCRHGQDLSRFCHSCAFPSQEEMDSDEQVRLAAELAEAAEKAAKEAKAAKWAAEKAAILASLTPYELAVSEKRWEDAYALLPPVCYLHEQDSDGYPPPPRREKKPSFTRFWEVMTSGWRDYRPSRRLR